MLHALQDIQRKRYTKEWYEPARSFGIRRKFDEEGRPVKRGKQIFSFGNGVEMTKEEKRKIGDRLLQRLERGMKEDDAKAWVNDKCK